MNELLIPACPTPEEQKALIEEGEARLNQQLRSVTEQLVSNTSLRMIGLTGPTCSGKTTAAGMITEALCHGGRQVQVISIDDFYYDKPYLAALTERKGMKTLDYDSEDTIDVALLRSCVESLREGRPTELPRFDFVSGDRIRGDTLIPRENDVFLFEGIQVLYPCVRKILEGDGYRSLLMAPQTALRVGEELFLPNEIRLMRRLVRDVYFRSTPPEFTLYLWEGVRANEERNIFPNLSACELQVDSTMPYELGVLKPFLERDLNGISKTNEFYNVGQSLLERLREVAPISHGLLPKKSLYKEFIAL